VRLYVDRTVPASTWRGLPDVEVVEYRCPAFLVGGGGHHDGTFGTVMRMLPLLDWPDGYEAVWVSDVDVAPPFLTEGRWHLDRMFELGYAYGYFNILGYNKPWVGGADPAVVNIRILARRPIAPPTLLRDFLVDVRASTKYADLFRAVTEKDGNRATAARWFPYGFDELFTNLPEFRPRRALVCQLLHIASRIRSMHYKAPIADPGTAHALAVLEATEAQYWREGRTRDFEAFVELQDSLAQTYGLPAELIRRFRLALRRRVHDTDVRLLETRK
jgi:hypothetical protein